MNKAMVYGVIFLGSAAVQAGVKLWEKRERRRRMNPAMWSADDLAHLVALKTIELKREREIAIEHAKAAMMISGVEPVRGKA